MRVETPDDNGYSPDVFRVKRSAPHRAETSASRACRASEIVGDFGL